MRLKVCNELPNMQKEYLKLKIEYMTVIKKKMELYYN